MLARAANLLRPQATKTSKAFNGLKSAQECDIGANDSTLFWHSMVDLSRFLSGARTEISASEYEAYSALKGKSVEAGDLTWLQASQDRASSFVLRDDLGRVVLFQQILGGFFGQMAPIVTNGEVADGKAPRGISGAEYSSTCNNHQSHFTADARLLVTQRDYLPYWRQMVKEKYWGFFANKKNSKEFNHRRHACCASRESLFDCIANGNVTCEGMRDKDIARSLSYDCMFFVQRDLQGKDWLIIKKGEVLEEHANLFELIETQGIAGFDEFLDKKQQIAVEDIPKHALFNREWHRG